MLNNEDSFLSLCYILRVIRAGRCRERRYAEYIFIQIYFRIHHFVVNYFKIFFASDGKGALSPLTIKSCGRSCCKTVLYIYITLFHQKLVDNKNERKKHLNMVIPDHGTRKSRWMHTIKLRIVPVSWTENSSSLCVWLTSPHLPSKQCLTQSYTGSFLPATLKYNRHIFFVSPRNSAIVVYEQLHVFDLMHNLNEW